MKFFKIFLLPLVGLFLATGCEDLMNNDSVDLDEDLQALSAGIDADIGLSRASMNAINKSMDRHGKKGKHREPGFLWKVASDMQSSLTGEEKTKMFNWVTNNSIPYIFDHGPGPSDGKRDNEKGGGMSLELIFSVLTDAQKEELKSIMESYRTKMGTVMEQFKNGEIDAESTKAQLQALEVAMKEEIENMLSDEQQASIDAKISQMKEEREARDKAERQAMIDAIGMTSDQEASLQNINDQHESSVKALFESVKSSGEGKTDRKALHEALKALMVKRNSSIENLFDADQMEVIKLHTFVTMQYAKHCNKGKRDGDKDGDKDGSNGKR